MDKREVSELSLANLQAFQDAFHLFERGEEVTFDGKVLDKELKEHGIQITEEQVDEVLSILNNHDESIDVNDFCYLVNSAVKYIGQQKTDVSSKKIVLSLKKFVQKSAAACPPRKHTWAKNKSADTLGFYLDGVRFKGLTERQLAERACSLDTTGSSPYKQAVVLPGLPVGDKSKGSRHLDSLAPCIILPPTTPDESGKRLSKCTILPYLASDRPLGARPQLRKSLFDAPPPPKYHPAPYSSVLEAQRKSCESERKASQAAAKATSKNLVPPIITIQTSAKVDTNIKKKRPRKVRCQARPLPFTLPKFPEVRDRFVTVEELADLRDRTIMIRENHRKKMREIAAKKIIESIPSMTYRKQFRSTIKAYLG